MYINGKKILSVVKAEKPTGIRESGLTVEFEETIKIDISGLKLFRAILENITTELDARDYVLYIKLYDANDNWLHTYSDILGDLENATFLIYKDFAVFYTSTGNTLESNKLSTTPAYITIYYTYRADTEITSTDEIYFSIEEL